MESTPPPLVGHHYQIASSPPIYSYLPSCQWVADSHALTWTLLHKLQENPSIRNVLWPTADGYPPCQTKWNASEELAIRVFADHPLYRPYVDADPGYYGRATQGKVWLLRKRYEEIKEKLEIAKKEAILGREGRRNIRKLWRSIKKEHPYYSLLMAINNDPEMTFESDSELDCRYEFNTPIASSAAPSGYESDVVAPEIRYGAATLRPARKRPPGGGGVTVDDEATVVEGSEEEEVEHRSNYVDDGNEDNKGHEGDTEDEEIREAQEEAQDEIHDQMDTDEELQEELESTHLGIVSRESRDELIVISGNSEMALSPLHPNRSFNAPEAAAFHPSVSACTKRTREDDSSDGVDLERLDEPNGLLDHEASSELHRDKVRRRYRFDVKVRERRAEREHEKYMIDARIKLATIRYGVMSSRIREKK